jgi:hypothetical protein
MYPGRGPSPCVAAAAPAAVGVARPLGDMAAAAPAAEDSVVCCSLQ